MSTTPATAGVPPSLRPLPERSNSRRVWDRFGWNLALAIEILTIIVLAEIARQSELLGINYLVAYLFFGTMTLADAMRSQQLFATEVMPKLADM